MIETHVNDSLHSAHGERPTSHDEKPERENTKSVSRLLSSWHVLKRYPIPLGALLLLLVSLLCWLLGRGDISRWVLLCTVLLGGIPLFWQTMRQLFQREFSVDVIALLAIIGTLWLGQYLAGAFVVLMLSGGEALEAYALGRARTSLSALAERAPRVAHIWQGENLVNIPAEAVTVGMSIVVKPGELVPVDGVVVRGDASISEADLTGEPVPVRKTPGMVILSGSLNLDGVIEIGANKLSAESKYAQILRLVQEAQEHKAPIHRLADRYSVVFTLATVLLAGAAWIISRDSIYALAVLVVATPCPLILATQIAIMSGIDKAARHGIIVKSGAVIEQLGEIDVAVFDKTGTLTLGVPKVTKLVLHEQDSDEANRVVEEERLLYYAASVEQLSTHILARSIVEAAQKQKVTLSIARHFEEAFGKGVSGFVPIFKREICPDVVENPVAVVVGNRSFLQHLKIVPPDWLLAERERRTAQGQLCSFIALDGHAMGLIVLEDVPRSELARLSPDLKQEGVKQTILLTGDSEEVAQQIGDAAHMDRVIARCFPEKKVAVIQELLAQKQRVLMVGDGVNDAPALATATVGIALGTQGLTAAASAADAVLLSTDILRIVAAVHLGRRVMRIAKQGIWIGMGLSAIAMIFAAFGYILPAAGAILQEGIDVLVILNALRVGGIMRDEESNKRSFAKEE